MTFRHRRGFTLIELLVVIAIIGVLIALLLPAVQSAREAARRSQCINNMKQLALGMMNYESANGSFPSGSGMAPANIGQRMAGWTEWSPQAMMLPFLEQGPIHQAINFDWAGGHGMGAEQNRTAWITQINTFLCPSDGRAGQGRSNNYYGSVGTTVHDWWGGVDNNIAVPPAWTAIYDTSGIFSKYRSYGIQDVTDGTSNTVAFGEVLVGGSTGGNANQNVRRNSVTGAVLGSDTYVDLRRRNAEILLPMTINQLQICQQAWMANQNIVNNTGQFWGWADTGMTLFNTIVPPNSTQYSFAACRHGCGGCSPDSASYVNSTSNHPGGCNVGFTDGSVRFIKATIAMPVWMALGTRDGGEVISSDQF